MLENLSKPENAAAVWSAIAATFSAIAAWFTWLSQERLLKHTFKPEIVLSGWARSEENDVNSDTLSFSLIKNVGRDISRTIIINAFSQADDGRPTYHMSTFSVVSLAHGDVAAVGQKIKLHWNNVSKHGKDGKCVEVKVSTWYWDALEVRHISSTHLMVFQNIETPFFGMPMVAPGAYLTSQTTVSESIKKVNILRWLGNKPIINKLLPDPRKQS